MTSETEICNMNRSVRKVSLAGAAGTTKNKTNYDCQQPDRHALPDETPGGTSVRSGEGLASVRVDYLEHDTEDERP